MSKNTKKTVTQSCDSRECNKTFSNEKSDLCSAITTLHYLDEENNVLICSVCNKKKKIE